MPTQERDVNARNLVVAELQVAHGMGGLSHSKLMTNIELVGTQVAPLVHDMLA